MRLDELDDIIENTTPDHWSVIGPPTFLHSFMVTGIIGDESHISAVEYHQSVAVLRSDVDVRIAWGYDPDFGERERSFFPQHTFPDESIGVELGDVFYRGALVSRYDLILVDGFRATLPMPHRRRKPEGSGRRLRAEDYELTASQREVNFARLVDGLRGNHEFDDYLRRAELVVRTDGDD